MAAIVRPSFIHVPADYLEVLPLAALFPVCQPVEVELGSGDGSFMAAYAKSHPETNFVGVERLLGRLRKLDRKAGRAELSNLRLIRIEASYFVEFMLPKEEITALHLYFPDPWPKRRHHKNRLVNERFPGVVAHCLKPGGTVYLRTDNRPYFDQMLECFGAARAFEAIETPADLKGFTTDFERGFNARGIPTLHAAYRKLPGGNVPG